MLKRIIFMAFAILAAGGTFVLVNNAKKANNTVVVQQVQEEKKGPFVLVAKKSLPAGSFVNPENLDWQLWPDDNLMAAYITKEETKIEDLTGSVVRRGFTAGEPITKERIIKPGDRGFVAAILKDGMRAVSVPVNATTGIAGLVFPGDQVDVILTHAIRQPNDDERPMRQVSETILRNVRVLAMDQTTDDQNAKPNVPKTATLELSPKQVEILMVSSELGKLSLSLRSLSDTEVPIEEIKKLKASFTIDGEASYLLSSSFGNKKVQVVRGSESEEVSVGGQ